MLNILNLDILQVFRYDLHGAFYYSCSACCVATWPQFIFTKAGQLYSLSSRSNIIYHLQLLASILFFLLWGFCYISCLYNL